MSGAPVVCVHGITQNGGIFEQLGRRLGNHGFAVQSVDLRGHGDSGREPPWNVDAHVDDLLETIDDLGIEQAAWIGHSFGGRLAAALAARAPERVSRLALLEPGLGVSPEKALRYAEIDRLDWSFATVDGAANALMASDAIVASPPETIAAYVRSDVKQGADGRYRFSHCPSAVVVAWSELALPDPPIADVPTLMGIAIAPLFDGRPGIGRYREALGSALTVVSLPGGHNVLWESPEETAAAVIAFLATG
jgi:lipase